MSGSVKGTAARILKINPKCIYIHCYCHRLNLAVASTCKVQRVRNLLDQVAAMSVFFNFSPKRNQCFLEHIERLCGESAKRKLHNVCRTRWLTRIVGVVIFEELLPAIISAFKEMAENKEKKFNSATSSEASSFLKMVTSFDFIVVLVICRNILLYTESVTVLLQSKTSDIVNAYEHIKTLIQTFSLMRRDIDAYHIKWYEEAVSLSQSLPVLVAEEIPRLCSRQKNRDNQPVDTPSEYFKVAVSIPLIDHIVTELTDRFSNESQVLLSAFYLVPEFLLQQETSNWRDKVDDFINFYSDDFQCVKSLKAEIDVWSHYWGSISTESPPNTIGKTLKFLKQLSPNLYPNITIAFKIIAVVPSTSCECERAVSTIRRLKEYARNSMTQERMNGLALLTIHRDVSIDTDDRVLNRFAASGNRRLDF